MKFLTIGKFRGLQQCTSSRGTFTCLALDHRQNLRKANAAFADDAELSRFKLDVTACLADLSTAVLLDPEVSAAQTVAAGALSGRSAFVVAVEIHRLWRFAHCPGEPDPPWLERGKSQAHGCQHDQVVGLLSS